MGNVAPGGGGRGGASNVFLISVDVMGSVGSLLFYVNEGELVSSVIHKALKSHARLCYFPVLGSDPNNFLLYRAKSDSDALQPSESIDSRGYWRNYVLCKKKGVVDEPGRNGSGSWKTWLNNSLSFEISKAFMSSLLLGRKVSQSWKTWLNESLSFGISKAFLSSLLLGRKVGESWKTWLNKLKKSLSFGIS